MPDNKPPPIRWYPRSHVVRHISQEGERTPHIGVEPLPPHEHLQAFIKEEEARQRMRIEKRQEKDMLTIARRRLNQTFATTLGIFAAVAIYAAAKRGTSQSDKENPGAVLLLPEPAENAPNDNVSDNGTIPPGIGMVGGGHLWPELQTVPTERPELLFVNRTHPLSEEQIATEVIPKLVTIEQNDTIIRIVRERERLHQDMIPDLDDLFKHAQQDGVTLFIRSAFRTIDEQAMIEGSSQFKEPPGASHHHLGTALDFTSPRVRNEVGSHTHFDTTHEGEWLLQEGYKYGFVFPYSNNDTSDSISFEPWHALWVGRENALFVHEQQLLNPDLGVEEILQEVLRYPEE